MPKKGKVHYVSRANGDMTACARGIPLKMQTTLVESEVTCSQCLKELPWQRQYAELKKAEGDKERDAEARRLNATLSTIPPTPSMRCEISLSFEPTRGES
jgi:hypothetical protein